MTWFIVVKPINGRNNFYNLISKIESNYGDRVEYHSGGWSDDNMAAVMPHLKFEFEDDAIAYSLTYGGIPQRTIPTYSEKDIKNAV